MTDFALTAPHFAQDPDEEYVPTPVWATRALLRVVPELKTMHGRVLEPAAGTGSIVRVLEAETRLQVWGVEINEERAQLVERELGLPGRFGNRLFHGDFLSPSIQEVLRCTTWQAIITNPPFSLYVPFVRAALELAKAEPILNPHPIVAMLAPLEYYGGLERSALYLPGTGFRGMYTFARRLWPKVKAATWYVWQAGYQGDAITSILEDGP